MILVDTDILSAMTKVERIHLLFDLFGVDTLQLASSVFQEVGFSFQQGRAYAQEIFSLLAANRFQIVFPTTEESSFVATLPSTLGAGERESVAIAKFRDGFVLSNESRVAHWCVQYKVKCVRLPDILRALWTESLVTQDQVRQIVHDLEVLDGMRFKRSTKDAIFSD